MVPHPIIVDFAVALLVVSVAFDILASVAEERDLRVVAWWTLIVGTVAAMLSAVSGYVASGIAGTAPVVIETVQIHRNLGLATVACFTICALWRIREPAAFPSRYRDAYWGVTAIGLGLLIVTAYYGGILVFRLGVGFVRPA